MKPTNKTIFERGIGRPSMMAFMLLAGSYAITGQIIPGVL